MLIFFFFDNGVVVKGGVFGNGLVEFIGIIVVFVNMIYGKGWVMFLNMFFWMYKVNVYEGGVMVLLIICLFLVYFFEWLIWIDVVYIIDILLICVMVISC